MLLRNKQAQLQRTVQAELEENRLVGRPAGFFYVTPNLGVEDIDKPSGQLHAPCI